MYVTRNTYPRLPNVACAEVGDAVEWQAGRRMLALVRTSDGRTVFARDYLPKAIEDTRPMIGVIASVKNKGWYLEITK